MVIGKDHAEICGMETIMKNKIEFYGTLGSACESEKTLEEMFRTGMTGVRVNLSHQDLDDREEWLENMRRSS